MIRDWLVHDAFRLYVPQIS